MSTTKPRSRQYTIPEPQEIILIQKLETIGEVHASKNGVHPMVVEAFLQAGAFLNDLAGRDGEGSAALQFTYMGATFHASFEFPDGPVSANRSLPVEDY